MNRQRPLKHEDGRHLPFESDDAIDPDAIPLSKGDGNGLHWREDGLYGSGAGSDALVFDGQTLVGSGLTSDPYRVNPSLAEDNALTTGIDGGLYVPDCCPRPRTSAMCLVGWHVGPGNDLYLLEDEIVIDLSTPGRVRIRVALEIDPGTLGPWIMHSRGHGMNPIIDVIELGLMEDGNTLPKVIATSLLLVGVLKADRMVFAPTYLAPSGAGMAMDKGLIHVIAAQLDVDRELLQDGIYRLIWMTRNAGTLSKVRLRSDMETLNAHGIYQASPLYWPTSGRCVLTGDPMPTPDYPGIPVVIPPEGDAPYWVTFFNEDGQRVQRGLPVTWHVRTDRTVQGAALTITTTLTGSEQAQYGLSAPVVVIPSGEMFAQLSVPTVADQDNREGGDLCVTINETGQVKRDPTTAAGLCAVIMTMPFVPD